MAKTIKFQVLGNSSGYKVTVKDKVALRQVVNRVAAKAGLTGAYEARSVKSGGRLDLDIDAGNLPGEDDGVVLLPEELTPASVRQPR